MSVERAATGTSLIDVLDRVLDKGIVIDAWVRVSLVGIDLLTIQARVVVASLETYLRTSQALGEVAGGAVVPFETTIRVEMNADRLTRVVTEPAASRRAPIRAA
jgi:hypothetical protein